MCLRARGALSQMRMNRMCVRARSTAGGGGAAAAGGGASVGGGRAARGGGAAKEPYNNQKSPEIKEQDSHSQTAKALNPDTVTCRSTCSWRAGATCLPRIASLCGLPSLR